MNKAGKNKEMLGGYTAVVGKDEITLTMNRAHEKC